MKKFNGKPFAIVGVNSDSSRDMVKELTAKEKITWRSFWDAGSPQGPIQCQWNINAWPTMYLIDHNGVIVERFHFRSDLEEFIAQKVKKAEAALQK